MLPLTAPLPAAAPLASVKLIVHRLTVTPPHRPSAAGRVGDPLFAAYALLTGAGDRASIKFVNNTTLHINQRTHLVLRSPLLSLLQKGEVEMLDRPGAHLQVQTAVALSTAVGTQYDVRITPNAGTSSYSGTPAAQSFPPGTTTVSVVSGLVDVSNRYGRVRVRAGEWTHVRPGQAPTRPTRHNARGDVAWAAGLP
jgi:ferric-dicitrate binding protein FerR (iron transport regulator)